MQYELDVIKKEFKEELDKRMELLHKIDILQKEISELQVRISVMTDTLKAIRKSYPMRNFLCKKCAWRNECTDAERVDGKDQICSSFVAEEV